MPILARRSLHILAIGSFFFLALGQLEGAERDAQIQAIDQEALSIDRSLAGLAKTSKQDCDENACRATDYFWGSDGRIRKMVEQKGSVTEQASTTARFYHDCHLILVRIAPADSRAVKTPANIERYYFHNGELLRIKFGPDDKLVTKDQQAYYQRIMSGGVQPCRQPSGGTR